MARYGAEVEWQLLGCEFSNQHYSRAHVWRFDGGVEVPASSSPQVVPLPYSVEQAVDPEEAFVASLASCHMLWFLAIAAKRGFVVMHYRDQAQGEMRANAKGKQFMARVVLRPQVVFAGEIQPTAHELNNMHDQAHEECFIANSVLTDVVCEPEPLMQVV